MLRYTAKVTLLALSWVPVVVTFTEHVAHIGRIEGISMKPALNPDASLGWSDYVLLWKLRVRDAAQLRVGDVVLLRSPQDPAKILIKRVLGVHGDTVLTRSPYPKPTARIPQNHLWVEGDNTFHSIDSNTFGPVSAGLVVAKATHVIFPFSRIGPVSSTPAREARLDVLKQASEHTTDADS